jgi:hypothetical protein
MPKKPPKPEGTKSNSRSWVSAVKDPAYWQELGEFIEAFASAETLLFNYLAMCAGLTHNTARALLSGIHADQVIDFIRRVWAVRPPDVDIQQKVDDALIQFKVIGAARNSMVHYVSFVTSDKGRISSNITRAVTVERTREFRVSPNIMREMIIDLAKISEHILYAINISGDPRISREDLMRQMPALAASWQYKPPQDHPGSKPKRN